MQSSILHVPYTKVFPSTSSKPQALCLCLHVSQYLEVIRHLILFFCSKKMVLASFGNLDGFVDKWQYNNIRGVKLQLRPMEI